MPSAEQEPGTEDSFGLSEILYDLSSHNTLGTVPIFQGQEEPPSYESLFRGNRATDTSLSGSNMATHDSLSRSNRATNTSLSGSDTATHDSLSRSNRNMDCEGITCRHEFAISCSITITISICMVIVGSIYLNDCPAEPNIPIFLIVGGTSSVLMFLLIFMAKFRRNIDREKVFMLPTAIFVFLGIWFMFGCRWVYNIDKSVTDVEFREDPKYCNKNLYLFAFWLISSVFIIPVLLFTCLLCLLYVEGMFKT